MSKSQAKMLIKTLAPLHIHSSLLNINMKIEESTDVAILKEGMLSRGLQMGLQQKRGKSYSIYQELMETSSLPADWEINVIFNFLIYYQLQDKYDNLQDGMVRRYHSMKTKWGITKCIDLKSVHDPLKGYLINDTCVFGVEENFALYPNGCREAKGNSISIFLSLPKSSIPDDTTKLFVKYILRIIDQFEGRHNEFEREIKNSYRTTSSIRVNICLLQPWIGVLGSSDRCINSRIQNRVFWWMTFASLKQKLLCLNCLEQSDEICC
ncbi:hypothetical protein Pint_35607 [Pistacia integerrima]|uniref:Uncharacterized protein n=1 Tax=Pistacia integerrima TaxID=434235 RepID=A0ACC0Y4A9_9ROSI|nr:hypothetical protein Pint_35607 [Pistacia integerrima]